MSKRTALWGALLTMLVVGLAGFPLWADISYYPSGRAGGWGTWGTITGTLSNQSDLQTELDGKGGECSSNGIMVRTASGACTPRSVTSSDGSLTVTNGTGVSGNVDLAVDSTTYVQYTTGTGGTPGTCSPGEAHFETDSDDFYPCTSTNTYTQMLTGASTTTLTNKTFDANGTGNSLSNVDVADLANGTDGELITWSATAAPATVAAGSADQVLTSNGAGAAPTFQDASGASFDPGTTFEIYEEFTAGDTASSRIGELGWHGVATSSGTYSTTITSSSGGNPGMGNLNSSATDDSGYTIYPFVSQNHLDVSDLDEDWALDVVMLLDPSAVTSTALFVGFGNSILDSTSQGVFIRYDTDHSDSTFIFMLCDASGTAGCQSAGDDTNADTHASTISPSADTAYRFRIRHAASGVGGNPTVYFRVNDETEITFCSAACDSTRANFASANVAPRIGYYTRTTAIREGFADYFWLQIEGMTRY